MTQQLYQTITERHHHALRHPIDEPLAEQYSAQGLSAVERMTRRFEWLMQKETPVILEGEDICYMRTLSGVPDVFTQQEWQAIRDEHDIHELGYLSNLCPNYAKVISQGLLALRDQADEHGRRTIDAILTLADRYRAEAERIGRQDIAQVLSVVPRYGATTLREALQFFRIVHFSLWYEGNYHVTVGRFDQYMYPYFERDLACGRLNEQSALALLEDFFLSFNKDSDLYPGVQQGDNGQSMMLGGTDANGNDCYNQLSTLCLRASCNNRLIDPKINLRVSKDTPLERLAEATRLTRAGLGFPQYSNDDVVIPALEALGYEHEDAVNYVTAACWEFIIPGVGTDIAKIAALSLPRAVDEAVHQDLAESPSYEAFFECVKQRICRQADQLCQGFTDVWFVPSPFMGLMMDCDPVAGGKYQNFGIHGTGIATAADSLAAIKRYVFEERTLEARQLIDAMDENFENTPQLLHKLRYLAPKLGNDDDFVDDIAVELLDAFADSLKDKRNSRGGIYRAGTGSAMYYLWHAGEIDASPDGRRRGEPFGTNFSVSLFAKVKGPVSVIASMTKPHLCRAINGGPLTLEFHQSVFAHEDGVMKVAALVKAFIERGGHQLQLNTVNPEQLADAQRHPEKYRHLVVRIWGWSAYFVELEKEYQDHVMARQAYSV